jgi:hypothetical protein
MIFKVFGLLILFGKTITYKENSKRTCLNDELTRLGCVCNSDNQIAMLDSNKVEGTCSKGIFALSCFLSNASNDFDYVIENLNDLDHVCWSDIRINNIFAMGQGSFGGLNFKTLQKNRDIHLMLSKISRIESDAFEDIQIGENQSLIINLDSPLESQSTFSIEKNWEYNCFSHIKNCKQFVIQNFIHKTEKFKLHTAYFDYSNVQMLVIRLSSFQGFVSSEWNHTRAAIENVLIENCFLNSIDKSTIGNFLSLRNVQIKSSQVNSIDDFAFEECCASLSTLNLNGNSIQHLRNNTFVGLENLQYLNLDENPIEAIDSQSFDTFKSNLKKLSLKFTYLKSTTTWLNQVMGSLKELDLSNTFHLNEVDFSQIFSMMPQLEYLALDKSFYLNRFKNLNEILNKIQDSRVETTNLKYLDLSSAYLSINETEFFTLYKVHGNCLWNQVLNKTLVKVNEHHSCSCALIYLYRNLANLKIPYKLSSSQEPFNQFLHDYYDANFDWSNTYKFNNLLAHLPKCYANLIYQCMNLSLLRQLEIECGFTTDECRPVNLTTIISTTNLPSEITTKSQNNNGLNTKQIDSNYIMPVVFLFFSFILISIVVLSLKARREYKRKFHMKFNQSIYNSTDEFGEMNELEQNRRRRSEVFAISIDDAASLVSFD